MIYSQLPVPVIISDDPGAEFLLSWRADYPLDTAVRGIARVSLAASPNLARYRVPEGEATRSLCGMALLPTPLLAVEIAGSLEAVKKSPSVHAQTSWEDDCRRQGRARIFAPRRISRLAAGTRTRKCVPVPFLSGLAIPIDLFTASRPATVGKIGATPLVLLSGVLET